MTTGQGNQLLRRFESILPAFAAVPRKRLFMNAVSFAARVRRELSDMVVRAHLLHGLLKELQCSHAVPSIVLLLPLGNALCCLHGMRPVLLVCRKPPMPCRRALPASLRGGTPHTKAEELIATNDGAAGL